LQYKYALPDSRVNRIRRILLHWGKIDSPGYDREWDRRRLQRRRVETDPPLAEADAHR
jgi:hypothetical protein